MPLLRGLCGGCHTETMPRPKRRKRRIPRIHNRSLTADQVRRIRAEYERMRAEGWQLGWHRMTGRRYGVSDSVISCVVLGKTYGWVE